MLPLVVKVVDGLEKLLMRGLNYCQLRIRVWQSNWELGLS